MAAPDLPREPTDGDRFARGILVGCLSGLFVWAMLVLPVLYFTGKL